MGAEQRPEHPNRRNRFISVLKVVVVVFAAAAVLGTVVLFVLREKDVYDFLLEWGITDAKWHTGDWSQCSKLCNGGQQTRQVKCESSIGNVAKELHCTDTKPTDTKECNTAPCGGYDRRRAPGPPAGDETQSQSAWDTGEWLACSEPCGRGRRSRDVMCRQQSDQVQVDDAQCPDPKPAVSEDCNTEPCMWRSGDWGECSKPCGVGQRTQPVECRSSANGVVEDRYCTGMRPTDKEECNTAPCETYTWVTGEWLACPEPCGGGQRTRDVVCRKQSDQARVDDAQCSDTKPAVSEACNTEPCMWRSGDWGECSKPCGVGQRTQPVECRSSANVVVKDKYCTGMRPTDKEECNTAPCETYTWVTGEWLACPEPCGGGQRTRDVVCRKQSDQARVDDAQCSDTKPAVSEACNTEPCMWRSGDWGECSKPCGVGQRTQPVECRSSANVVVKDKYCTGMRPTDKEECNTAPCEIPKSDPPKPNHRVPNINVSRYIFMNGTSDPPSWSKHLMAGHVRYYPGAPIWDIGEAARSVGVIVGRNHGYVEGYPTWLIWRERDHAKSFDKLHYWQHDNSGSYMAAIYMLWGTNQISNDEKPSMDGGWTPIGHFRVGKVGSKSEQQKVGPHVAQQLNENSAGNWEPTNDGPLSTEPFGIWGITPAYLGWKAYAHGVSISRLSVNEPADKSLDDHETAILGNRTLTYL